MHCQLVAIDKDPGLCLKESVDVFQRAIRRLWIEEVGNGNEREADDCPYDPKPVTKTFDTGKRSLYNCVVAYPVTELSVRGLTCRRYSSTYEAIASEAPFVRISSALILHPYQSPGRAISGVNLLSWI